MGLFRKKQPLHGSRMVQTLPRSDAALPNPEPDNASCQLYQALRSSVPILDAAINKIIRLTGSFTLHCEEASMQEALQQFAESVPVGVSGISLQTFADGYLDSLLTYGNAVGELLLEESSGTGVPEGMVLVNDLYEGQRLVPDFDMDLNQYDTEKFVEENGFIRYQDGKAVAGVDVSEHQGTIDWQQVKDAGFEYAILRVAYRGMTEGGLNVDSTFEQNYQGATAAGLKVGVYFFSQAITQEEAREEAQYVLDTLDGRELDYPVVFDWEIPIPSEQLPAEDLRAYDISGEVVTAMAKAFCQEIQSNGYTPCVYTNKSMAYNTFNLEELKDFPLWYAEYQPAPSLYYHFQMWQYSASGTVPGIAGSADLNICFEPY